MKIYKFILKLCLLIFLSQNVFAQQNQFKNERRIYLWDVTLSMKGYDGKTPDISKDYTPYLGDKLASLKDWQEFIDGNGEDKYLTIKTLFFNNEYTPRGTANDFNIDPNDPPKESNPAPIKSNNDIPLSKLAAPKLPIPLIAVSKSSFHFLSAFSLSLAAI